MTDTEINKAAAEMLRWWADQTESGVRISSDALDDYFFTAYPDATPIDAKFVADRMLEAVSLKH